MGGTGHETLQALLAFSALHEQVRRQTQAESASSNPGQIEKFVLDEVLQLVSDRAVALTGANGVAIALEEGGEIICRASSGTIAPDKRAKLNPNSGFSGACFRTGQIIRCDDTETDERVNVHAARRLGTRSMVAVPLIGRDGSVGLIEAFSSKAYAFQDSSIRSLNLLAELILGAMKPEVQSQPAEALPSMPVLEGKSPVESPVESQPVVETPAPWPTVEAIREKVAPLIAEPVPAIESQPEEQAPSSRLGLMIVIGLVLVAMVAGTGIWWKLRAPQAVHPGSPSSNVSQVAQPPATPALSQDVTKAASDGPIAITGIRHWSSPSSSTVVVDLQDNVRYEEHRLSDPDRIYFDLPDTTLDHKLTGKVFEVGDTFLLRVRVAQPTPGTTRVVLDTRNNPDYKVRLNQAPYRLEVEVHSANAPGPPKTSFNLFTPSQPPAQSPLAPTHIAEAKAPAATSSRTENREVKTPVSKFVVALDAGHGGWDEGTIGRRGLMEKDLALDIVARLGKLITEKLGGEVIYTRRDDTYIPLEKRAEIANLAQADFFVSIHANYSDTPSARGVETYYSNTYSSLNARIPGTTEPVKQVDWTSVDIREKALQSEQLAADVQRALFARVAKENPGIDDRGVKKASYVVLTGTTMPAILTEVSFVSSPADEKRLKRSEYRQQIAEAIYKGISRYAAAQHKVTMASASSKPTAR
jgi:N-acetylmuramoyl-L-alanine amidase